MGCDADLGGDAPPGATGSNGSTPAATPALAAADLALLDALLAAVGAARRGAPAATGRVLNAARDEIRALRALGGAARGDAVGTGGRSGRRVPGLVDRVTRTADSGVVAALAACLGAGLAGAAITPDAAPRGGGPGPAGWGDADTLAALAAEHALVFGYGALGARTSQSSAPAAFALVSGRYDLHRARRDALASALRSRGVEPVGPLTAYDVPATRDVLAVLGEVVRLESGAARTWAWLLSRAEPADRAVARAWLVDAARAAALAVALGSRVPVPPLPGWVAPA